MTFSTHNITSSSVDLYITDMNSYYTTKRIIITLNGDELDPQEFTAGAMRVHHLTGLSSNTYYYITIQIQYWVDGWVLDGSSSDSFTTKSDGGGGGDTPYFTAEAVNNIISVQIYNLSSYNNIQFYLWEDGDTSRPIKQSPRSYQYDFYDFEDLDPGYYDVSVEYNNGAEIIYTSNGYERLSLYVGGEGTTPTYTYSQNNNSITLNAQNKGTYLLNYIVRLDSDPDDQSHTLYRTNNTSYTADDLQWDTDYRVNVGYSTVEDPYHITWISDSGPLLHIGTQPSGDDGYVYIYTGPGESQGWKKAKPYIYAYGRDGNLDWQPVIPYIYAYGRDGNLDWQKCVE